ncbi:ArsR family transcriptional regulator [Halostella sp. JP-L12]|uniref:winged helix-turn-helix transcriptional regulator n=1 Tax=Halostella TaxID=1843185 RepID=UPI000EF8463B|nr:MULTISPECIES: helix-turn-helix domain-containing protein [Halostella]NHN46039.1 ArsR family transcriptional regulator [Halostella sp. JP-L12]
MSETRARIERRIGEDPGVHFNELVRALDLAPGQVQYHVGRLLDAGRLDRERLYGRTHYFPPETDEWERGALSLCRRETARDVLASLIVSGPQRPAAVADDLGVARSTLEWHLDHLVEQGVVRKERDDRGRVTLVLARPTETARLLDAVSPSLPERMVDRFTRLVDDLFAE